MHRCKAGSARARVALAVGLFVAGAAVGCSDAECPNGTVEINAHCVKQAAAPSTASSAGAGAASSASGAVAGNQSAAISGSSAGVSPPNDSAGRSAIGTTTLANGEPCARAEECTGGFCKTCATAAGSVAVRPAIVARCPMIARRPIVKRRCVRTCRRVEGRKRAPRASRTSAPR
jgi:hypothetical protein